MFRPLFPVFAFSIPLCFATMVCADDLARYNFDGDSFASSVTSAEFSATDMTSGPGFPLATISTGVNPTPPSLSLTFANVGNSFATSFAAGDFYSFTVTPEAGTELTFNELNFDFYKNSGAGATVTASLLTSLGGFGGAADIVDTATLVGSGEGGSFLPRTFDLSSLAANVTTPVEFRIYLDDGNATTSTHPLRLDNIVLDGTAFTAVPEPTSVVMWSLTGLGLAAFGYYRTRRKK